MQDSAVIPTPAQAADTSSSTKAKRLHEVLREEHHHLPEGVPSSAPPPQKEERSPAHDITRFQLVEGEELARRVSRLLPSATAKATSGGGPTAPVSADERQYARLAEWVIEHRKGAGDGAVTEDEIQTVLADRLRKDLPRTEEWMKNADLRPFTRGLLALHLKRKSWRLGRFGPKPQHDPELNRLLLEDVFAKYVKRRDEQLLQEVMEEMRTSGRAALCLSGGGIRSATFALGVVQGFARHGVLGNFRYLSTVSGGGYLGSWLSAWSRQEGMKGVIDKLDGDQSAIPSMEAAPVRHLRQYSNYLSPQFGLLSGDTWTLAATFLRNLLLIWLVLVPLLAIVTALPWVVASLGALEFPEKGMWTSRGFWITVLGLFAAVLATRAISFVHASRPETDGDVREGTTLRLRRDQSAFMRLCLLPLSLAVVLWALAWRWFMYLTPGGTGWLADLHRKFEFDPDSGASAISAISAISALKAGVASDFVVHHPVLSRGTALMMLGGAAIHLVGWLFALRVRAHVRRGWLLVREVAAIVGTGAAAGLLLVLTSRLLTGLPALSDLRSFHFFEGGYAALAVPGFLTAIILAGFAFEGLASKVTKDAEREWTARYSAWVLVVSLAWLALSGLVLFGPHLAQQAMGAQLAAGAGAGSGILAALLGRSSRTESEAAATKKEKKRDWGAVLSRMTLPVASVVAIVALVIALSALDTALISWSCSWSWLKPCGASNTLVSATLPGIIKAVPWYVMAALPVVLWALGMVLGWLIETNRFSLHAMYRARLIRAYLGASRPAGERHPDPFTGFDEADNIHMGCLGRCADGVSDADGANRPPFHVVNMALNLVAGRNLAWQERKAASFTVSPLHAGAAGLGYRRTRLQTQKCPVPDEDPRYYGGDRGITLGTAVTISGAAASPNMGYHSSPLVTFLMTLFNARLGWWLGNPGPAGEATFHQSSPRSALKSLLGELVGATNDTNEYVYLSDGGHFENLGLYEMVLRRNRFVVVSDAGCDEACTLQDLGNAIRKIRIDLGIPIEFQGDFGPRARSADPTAAAGRSWAWARIDYSCVDLPAGSDRDVNEVNGVLLYIKPGIYGDEPRDVFNYAAANPAFPHESTADQFFSESQFESYRALGSHAVEQLVRTFPADGLKSLFTVQGQNDFWGSKNKPASTEPSTPAGESVGRKIKIDGILQEA